MTMRLRKGHNKRFRQQNSAGLKPCPEPSLLGKLIPAIFFCSIRYKKKYHVKDCPFLSQTETETERERDIKKKRDTRERKKERRKKGGGRERERKERERERERERNTNTLRVN